MSRSRARLVALATLGSLVMLISIGGSAIAGAPKCKGRTVTIAGNNSDNTIFGTVGADVIDGKGGNDRIHSLEGDDTICPGGGNDTVEAGSGDDTVRHSPGHDGIKGGGGDDQLTDSTYQGCFLPPPNSGLVSFVAGGAGDDSITGSRATGGGSGDDSIQVLLPSAPGAGACFIVESRGGTGSDVIFALGPAPAYQTTVAVQLNGGDGDDRLLASAASDDGLSGGSGDDSLNGGSGGSDTCDGGSGVDVQADCEIPSNFP